MNVRHIQRTREWAVKNCAFSLKTSEGYWGPFGDLLAVPSNVNRKGRFYAKQSGGWAVRLDDGFGNMVVFNFPDHKYGHDYRASLQAALEKVNESMGEMSLKPFCRLYRKEMDRKLRPTDHVGVFIWEQNGGTIVRAKLGEKTKTIVVNDYSDVRVQTAIDRAARIREDYEREYVHKHRFVAGR